MATTPDLEPTNLERYESMDDSEEDEEELGGWDEDEDEDEDEESSSSFLCLFCETVYGSCASLFDHCSSAHHFDFDGIRKALGLDFYGSFKLVNYVRSQVAKNRCWSCGSECTSNQDLLNHSHEAYSVEDVKLRIDDDEYLKPFLEEDPLLYSFDEDEVGEDDSSTLVDKEELVKDLRELAKDWREIEGISSNFELPVDEAASSSEPTKGGGCRDVASTSNGKTETAGSMNSCNPLRGATFLPKEMGSDLKIRAEVRSSNGNYENGKEGNWLKRRTANDVRSVNENYFGAYSSFGIHREMISDKVRMDAYSQAILRNPSLVSGAVVMDVGCGTGILSLFAAQAGASKVIAIEASEKMAGVATQIAKDNGLWRSGRPDGCNDSCKGVVEVVHSMVEELDKSIQIQPHSVDVLISEWMGYCLLYESMLNSVLYARDRWLKPGGAILPDTATIFAAGFGKGATSIPFWEDVYSFNMSCIGKEIVEDAARYPIVDVVNDADLVTDAVLLQAFDLVTMKPDEVDFTSNIEIVPKSAGLADKDGKPTWCYGVVLWFETGFTSRFCKDFPAVLSTSPATPKTHWAQTILTFREPIAMSSTRPCADRLAPVGTDACPAEKIRLRVSIARAPEHRSIDISLEAVGIDLAGRKRSWPVQIFNLC
ncbi:probable protein arginine N-methyltransferase 3 [Syzygium oleosum]|uniref:probable protein arginine N-methyltransferase 3 n=1 Tax=Syzygium oleosum TaxID=219896 RepID=UPI0011D2162E|nr:probable protein arginine N-methyltransferase 3 [Syzygium oleosum]